MVRLLLLGLMLVSLACAGSGRGSPDQVEPISRAVARHHDAQLIAYPLAPPPAVADSAATTRPTTIPALVQPRTTLEVRHVVVHRDQATVTYNLSDTRTKFVRLRGKAWLLRRDGQWTVTRHDLRP